MNGNIVYTLDTQMPFDERFYEWGLYDSFEEIKRKRNKMLLEFIVFITKELINKRELKDEYKEFPFELDYLQKENLYEMYSKLNKGKFMKYMYRKYKI